jgi:hypothetical protein
MPAAICSASEGRPLPFDARRGLALGRTVSRAKRSTAFCFATLVWVSLVSVATVQDASSMEAGDLSPMPLTDRWTVCFRFVGVPQEGVWVFYDPDAPFPEGPIDVREFVKFDICEVTLGKPPRDMDGQYRYVRLGAGATVFPYGDRIPGLRYEVTGFWRKDPASGAVLYKSCVRELWGRWLAMLAAYGAAATTGVVVLVLLVRRLARTVLAR